MSSASVWGRRLLTLMAGTAGGYAAYLANVPLAWVLGSMMGVAILTLLRGSIKQPLQLRRGAQITIGIALGLTFTQAVIREVASLGHWMVLGAAFSVGMTMLFARALQRMARMDGATATYAVAVGASSEMALQAQNAGADGAQVASAHAIRIILVVTLASVVAHYSGQSAVNFFSAGMPELHWQLAVFLLFTAPVVGWLASRVRMPNPWLLGPVVLAGVFAANGTTARMYPLALIAAQILIGWNLGQHMTREFFRRSPRVLMAASTVTVGMLALCLLLAWSVSRTGAFTLLTAFLAVAPGGTAEMAIIAKNFGIGAPIVTAFHFFRVISTVLLIGWVGKTLLRTGWVTKEAPGGEKQPGS